MTPERVFAATAVFAVVTMAVLWLRLRIIPRPWASESDIEDAVAKALRTRLAPPKVVDTLKHRKVQPVDIDAGLTHGDKRRLRLLFRVVLAMQIVGGVLLLAAIFSVFSFLVAEKGALFALGASWSIPGTGFEVSQAMLKVIAMLCALAGLFFVVVTLADDKAVKGFAEFERKRLVIALGVWAMYKAAYNAVHAKQN